MIKITNKVATDNVRKVLLNNFLNDTFTNKINLLRGVYRDDYDKPYVLVRLPYTGTPWNDRGY